MSGGDFISKALEAAESWMPQESWQPMMRGVSAGDPESYVQLEFFTRYAVGMDVRRKVAERFEEVCFAARHPLPSSPVQLVEEDMEFLQGHGYRVRNHEDVTRSLFDDILDTLTPRSEVEWTPLIRKLGLIFSLHAEAADSSLNVPAFVGRYCNQIKNVAPPWCELSIDVLLAITSAAASAQRERIFRRIEETSDRLDYDIGEIMRPVVKIALPELSRSARERITRRLLDLYNRDRDLFCRHMERILLERVRLLPFELAWFLDTLCGTRITAHVKEGIADYGSAVDEPLRTLEVIFLDIFPPLLPPDGTGAVIDVLRDLLMNPDTRTGAMGALLTAEQCLSSAEWQGKETGTTARYRGRLAAAWHGVASALPESIAADELRAVCRTRSEQNWLRAGMIAFAAAQQVHMAGHAMARRRLYEAANRASRAIRLLESVQPSDETLDVKGLALITLGEATPAGNGLDEARDRISEGEEIFRRAGDQEKLGRALFVKALNRLRTFEFIHDTSGVEGSGLEGLRGHPDFKRAENALTEAGEAIEELTRLSQHGRSVSCLVEELQAHLALHRNRYKDSAEGFRAALDMLPASAGFARAQAMVNLALAHQGMAKTAGGDERKQHFERSLELASEARKVLLRWTAGLGGDEPSEWIIDSLEGLVKIPLRALEELGRIHEAWSHVNPFHDPGAKGDSSGDIKRSLQPGLGLLELVSEGVGHPILCRLRTQDAVDEWIIANEWKDLGRAKARLLHMAQTSGGTWSEMLQATDDLATRLGELAWSPSPDGGPCLVERLRSRRVKTVGVMGHLFLSGMPLSIARREDCTFIEEFDVVTCPSYALAHALGGRRSVDDGSCAAGQKEAMIIQGSDDFHNQVPAALKNAESLLSDICCPFLMKVETSAGFRRIHIDAHGRVIWNTEGSGLLLGPEKDDPSFWLLSDAIEEMDLRCTEEVWLSACVSAVSSDLGLRSGGTTAAFLKAGARHVIGTLWEAHTESLTDIANAYYRLRDEGLSVTKALCQAQRDQIKAGKSGKGYDLAGTVLRASKVLRAGTRPDLVIKAGADHPYIFGAPVVVSMPWKSS